MCRRKVLTSLDEEAILLAGTVFCDAIHCGYFSKSFLIAFLMPANSSSFFEASPSEDETST